MVLYLTVSLTVKSPVRVTVNVVTWVLASYVGGATVQLLAAQADCPKDNAVSISTTTLASRLLPLDSRPLTLAS